MRCGGSPVPPNKRLERTRRNGSSICSNLGEPLKRDVRHLRISSNITMNIEAQPLGNEYRVDGKESDIVEVLHSLSGLRIIVSTWIDSINEALLEVYFRRAQGYRYLDEGDLIAYWQTEKFRTPHHVYEITNGGWLTGETVETGTLDVAKSFEMREWFITTTNGCMTVMAASPPVLTDLKR